MTLTSEDVQKITVDTLNGQPQRVMGPAADAFRKELAKDLAKADREGWTVEVPFELEVQKD